MTPIRDHRRLDRTLQRGGLLTLGLFAFLAVACDHPSIDLNAINALVAPKHTMKLKFVASEQSTGVKRTVRYLAGVPRGWMTGDGYITPHNNRASLVFGNAYMTIRSSCDQKECKVEEWNADIDGKLAVDADVYDTERDEKSANRRVVFRRDRHNSGHVVIDVFWWGDRATEYHACSVSLGAELSESAPAFEKACQSVVVLSR